MSDPQEVFEIGAPDITRPSAVCCDGSGAVFTAQPPGAVRVPDACTAGTGDSPRPIRRWGLPRRTRILQRRLATSDSRSTPATREAI